MSDYWVYPDAPAPHATTVHEPEEGLKHPIRFVRFPNKDEDTPVNPSDEFVWDARRYPNGKPVRREWIRNQQVDVPHEGDPRPGPEAVTAAVVNILQAADQAVQDNVTLPEHYARFEIEPIRFICENNLNFFQGNIVKYILRWDAKNGLEDLKKAKRYLEMFIKWVEKDPDWWKAPA